MDRELRDKLHLITSNKSFVFLEDIAEEANCHVDDVKEYLDRVVLDSFWLAKLDVKAALDNMASSTTATAVKDFVVMFKPDSTKAGKVRRKLGVNIAKESNAIDTTIPS